MRSILFILLAALSLSAQAQLWELADQRNENIWLNNALPVGEGRWAVVGRTSFAGAHMISVRNGDGMIAWEQIDHYSTAQDYGAVVLMPDSGLLHVGAYDGCDYYPPESRVRRYAPNGNVLWERIMASEETGPITMAAKGSIGLVAVASQDSLYIMDMDGNMVGGYQSPLSDIRKIIWAGDTSLVIVRGTDLHLMDIDGTELASTPVGSIVVDMEWSKQDLFVLANDSIRRFSVGLAPLDIAALPDLDAKSRFVVSEDSLFVNTAVGLYQLAADGTPAFLFPWPALPNLSSTGCAVRNSTVLSIGNTNISGRRTGVIRTLSMNGDAPQHDQNVEVILQVDSAWTEFVGGFYPWDRHADITGFVVNHGLDTLHSAVLSMWVQVPWILCDQFTNRIDTSGFALAPGDTLSLPFGAVGVRLGLQSAQAAGTDEICIVALAPDHLADRAPQDNTACVSVDFVLGVEEKEGIAPLALFPTPASNACTVSGLAALGDQLRLSILDGTGRVALERTVTSPGDRVELDISSLPPGTYILDAMGPRARSTAKLIVVRP